jgi:hypothetical protein
MRNLLSKAGWILGLVAMGAGYASAADSQGPWDVQFKIRSGLQLADTSDNLAPYMLGAGVDVGYTTSTGRFSAELGYLYKPGRQYTYDLNSLPNPNGLAIDTNEGGNSPSTDLRRNQVSGITLRLQYQTWFQDSDWGAQAGIELGKMKFRHEYYGYITDGDYLGNGSQKPETYDDLYFGTPTKSDFKFNVFAGLSWKLDENSHLEFNVRTVSYSNLEYIHVVGTTVYDALNHVSNPKDTTKSTTRVIPHLEIGYAIRF